MAVLRMHNENMQFGPYLWLNRRNSCILEEIWVREHDDDVIFLTRRINMAVSRMRNEKICNLALTCGRIAYQLGYGADTMFHRTYFLFIVLNVMVRIIFLVLVFTAVAIITCLFT